MKGIYKIINTITNNFYIGSSKDIKTRWKTHIRLLKNNKHPNIILQKNFNKYGIENIKLEIVKEVTDETLLIIEQEYLDKLQPNINIGKNASGGDNLTKHPRRLEIIEQIRKSTIKRIENLGEKFWIEWGARYKGTKNPNYGNKWSDEQKLNSSNKMKKYFENHDSYIKGKKLEDVFDIVKVAEIKQKISNHAKTRIGEKNPFWNKKHTDEFKQNQSKRMIGNIPKNKRPFIINTIRYESLYEAAKILNISYSTIQYRLNSLNKKFKDYQYI